MRFSPTFIFCVPSVLSSLVATPLGGKCEDEIHTPEIGTWESYGIPKISEFDCRGQNASHWGVPYIIESY
jgi:hypothetical protein